MILTKNGESINTKFGAFSVGQSVVGNIAADEYECLKGSIIEIRTGSDRDTENKTEDIYVCFDVPEDPAIIKKLEAAFSEAYQEPKSIEDIPLDMVIMAPEMLTAIPKTLVLETPYSKIEIGIKISSYPKNSGLRINLISIDEDGFEEPYAEVTANLDFELPVFQAHIKNYSENEGMIKFLLDNKLGKIIGERQSNFVAFPVFLFDEDRLKEFDESGLNDYKSKIK